MNAHSFERQLRDMNPPAADPGAKLLARQAALVEFERLHGSREVVKPAPSRVGWKLFAWPKGRMAWGGMATACVALIAISMLWLTPPAQRTIHVPVTMVADQGEEIVAESPSAAPKMELPPPPPAQPATRLDRRSVPQPAPQSAPAAAEGDLQSAAATELAPIAPPAIAAERSRALTRNATSALAIANDSLEEVQVTSSLRAQRAPPSAGPGRFEQFEINPVKRVADEPVSTFSADVDTASYSVVRRQINAGQVPDGDTVRVEEMINYFDYAWPAATSRSQPFKPTVTISNSPWDENRKLVHIGIKGYELPAGQQPDVNLVLLLDVSGSMDEPDKLPLVKQSMALLLESLKPTDTVAIVVYAGAAGQVLAPTRVRDRETILRALYSLQPGGSTAGAEGIRLAYRLAERNFRTEGVNRILLATDGDFNVGIDDPDRLKNFVARERDKGVFLSVLGFGTGNYRDDMAQALAQNGNGVAAYIDTPAEAKKVLVQQATSSLFTIAKDVKLQVEFNPATVAEYRLIGYETRALEEQDFNNDKVDAGDVGSGHTVTAIYEILPVASKSGLLDERRYAGQQPAAAASRGKADEYGYLRIRYKLPDSNRSRLIEQPIRVDAGVPQSLRRDVAFSTAVAGFGQMLHDDRYTGAWKLTDVIRMAQPVGEDAHGYRAEFVQLVRRLQSIEGPGAPRE